MARVEEIQTMNTARQNEDLKGVCKETAKLFKILSNSVRLEILCHILSRKEICVKNLTEFLGRRQANVSQHLAILRNTGIIDFTRRENYVCYFLKDKKLVKLLMEFKSTIGKSRMIDFCREDGRGILVEQKFKLITAK
ncbi:MAG: winged helix-turn-helix transcriptional regulator [Nitrospirae bacterium]|nr:winged helix-turn-helix transcriptional regulator [Nitrospirota bacterium]